MPPWEKEIIKKQTAEEMAHAYQKAVVLIRESFDLLKDANTLMRSAFGEYNGFRIDKNADDIIFQLKRDAWRRIIALLEIDKIASVKRLDEIDKKISSGDIPEITVANIYDILMTLHQNASDIQKELVDEVYEILRPSKRWDGYKTNSEFRVGKKVILSWKIEHKWNGYFEVRSGAKDNVMAIDKVFHLLDGKGIPDGYNGPLVDAIGNSGRSGEGETEYFKFKCHHNRNLHLTFKRMDLVHALNAVAGGSMLKESEI
jgi:hypothetical protein